MSHGRFVVRMYQNEKEYELAKKAELNVLLPYYETDRDVIFVISSDQGWCLFISLLVVI